jgi:hypothetical protein
VKAVLAAAAAAAVQADGQTAHWLHGAPTMTAVSACTCASLNQRSNPLLPTCHFLQLCVDAPKEGPEGSMRGGGLFLEQHAWTPTGLFITALPLQASCFLYQLLSCLSLSSFSWSLSSPSAGEWGFEIGPGFHTGTMRGHF